ncbi:hypothetical protein GG344DRAFT_68107 [Lentinula edodes]|nr:hypothetical protein GG344DRAFT_68107 [Lentinula edodes]
MLTLSLLRLLAGFLLLLSLLVVSAAPLTGRTDSPTRVKKPDLKKSPKFHIGHRNGFVPVRRHGQGAAAAAGTNSDIFTGRCFTNGNCWAKPIARVNFEKVKRTSVHLDMQTVVKGSSTWDYMAKAMEYLQQNRELEFKFEGNGEDRWKFLLKVCGGKQEPNTLEVQSSTAGSGIGESSQKKLPTLSDMLIGGKAGNVTNAV